MLKVLLLLLFTSFVLVCFWTVYLSVPATDGPTPYPVYFFYGMSIIFVGYILYKGEDLLK